MAPGARSKFGVPMFEPGVFRKQTYCLKKVLATWLGLFGVHLNDSAPVELFPPFPLVTPLATTKLKEKNN